MGSEMCIRDSIWPGHRQAGLFVDDVGRQKREPSRGDASLQCAGCLLYTSDAADERSSVDLGGRRIIKKKNIKEPVQNSPRRSRPTTNCEHKSEKSKYKK